MNNQLTRQNPLEKSPRFFILIAFILFIGVTLLFSRPSGLASAREKPTPTPMAKSPNAPDIVGGGLASAGEYPWQVALISSGYSNPYNGQFCGGSLIDEEWVLSAGHCVEDNGLITDPDDIDVLVGTNVLSQGPTSGSSGQRINVDAIYLYPGFNYGSNDEVNKDASLLHLESPAVLSSLVSTITLASPTDTSQVAPGVTSTVTGWGYTSETSGVTVDALREVQVPIVSYATCMAGYGGQFQLSDAYHLCAGLAAGGKDSCYGDSGGPLIVPGGSGWLLAGIVSFGVGCAEPNYYGIYSRVSYFKSWIDGIIGITGETKNPAYLPLIMGTTSGTSDSCTPDPSGDSDNTSDALIICSSQTVTGTTNHTTDMDDVYKIYVPSQKIITITMSGSGGDSDLYLFPPGTTDVTADAWAARSTNADNNEYISETVNTAGYWYVDIYSLLNSTTNYQVIVTVT